MGRGGWRRPPAPPAFCLSVPRPAADGSACYVSVSGRYACGRRLCW